MVSDQLSATDPPAAHYNQDPIATRFVAGRCKAAGQYASGASRRMWR